MIRWTLAERKESVLRWTPAAVPDLAHECTIVCRELDACPLLESFNVSDRQRWIEHLPSLNHNLSKFGNARGDPWRAT